MPGSDSSASPRPDERYWRRTLRFTLILLAVWFLAGYVVAIVAAPWLNQFQFLGGPLGFWVAQNGAIYVFWLLILVYAVGMNRLDREFGVHDAGLGAAADDDDGPDGAAGSGPSDHSGARRTGPDSGVSDPDAAGGAPAGGEG